MTTFTTTTLLIALAAASFLILERVRPGRELPNAPGWYAQALVITMFQLGITLATSKLWGHRFVGTFFFYCWHRIRHRRGWWVLFHQVHHSPTRIEAITSFYKHPVEILAD